jgi:chromosome segregation ATPase
MVNLKSSIGQLQEKLTALLKQYTHLEKENQQLKANLLQQTNLNQELSQKVVEGQSQLTAALMNQGASMDPAEKAKLVKKIDQYIKEIDHSLHNLNP